MYKTGNCIYVFIHASNANSCFSKPFFRYRIHIFFNSHAGANGLPALFPGWSKIATLVLYWKRSTWLNKGLSHINAKSPYVNIYIYIYTTGKKYGIFFIAAIFCIFVEYEGCFCTRNKFLRADINFAGVNFHLTAKWSAKVKKTLFRYFSQLDYG